MSSKPKKHLKQNKITKKISTITKKYFSKNKGHSNETNLQNENCKKDNFSLWTNNVMYGDYNIKDTRRLLDKGGYEVPICQHQYYLSKQDEQNITTLNNTGYQIQNNKKISTRKLQATNLVKPSQVSQSLKTSSVIENEDKQTLNDLKGLVHKRITMFEKNHTI